MHSLYLRYLCKLIFYYLESTFGKSDCKQKDGIWLQIVNKVVFVVINCKLRYWRVSWKNFSIFYFYFFLVFCLGEGELMG